MNRAVCLFMLLFPLALFGQEPTSEPSTQPALTPTVAAPPAITVEPPVNNKKPIVAFGASLGAAAIGGTLSILSVDSFLDVNLDQGRALGVLGLVILSAGPSAGHLYAGDIKHAAIFSGARFAMTGLFLAGLSTSKKGALDVDLLKTATGNSIMIMSGVSLLSFGLYDVVDAPFSVKREKEPLFGWRVVPAPILAANQSLIPGMLLTTNF